MGRNFRLLGVLDIMSMVLLLAQFVSVFPILWSNTPEAIPANDPLWLNRYILIPQLLLIPLLALGALGHFQGKTYGLVLYYIQFPLRFPALVFTFGFVTYLDALFSQYDISRYTLAIPIFGELLRLTYSVQYHIRSHRAHLPES